MEKVMSNTHILVQEFDYFEPASVEEAIALLAQYGGQAKVMAGGTDLLVQMKMERVNPRYVINIKKIPGLSGIVENGHLEIGALTTIRQLAKSPIVQRRYTALAEACRSFSTTQVQLMGTIGGNLCNGSPAADSAPALLVFEAEATLSGSAGERTIPLEQFFLGPGQTALTADELLTGLRLPAPPSQTGSVFLKIGRVAADIAKANAAVALTREGQRVARCRIALGSVAPTPVRARKAEAAIAGQPYSEGLVDEISRLAAEEASPITDVRSTAEYRREICRVMVRDGIGLAWQRAAGQE
jgi:CO/xanthine dehydrogenase FAD-binding subunit